MKKVIPLAILLLCLYNGFSQEKYAIVLNSWEITSNRADSLESYALANPGYEPYYEFWNDVYLMWEMLYQRGFKDENIFYVYQWGDDYNPTFYNERYTADYHYLDKITDYRATKTALDSVFLGLSDGSYGFPKVEEDDFFVLYIFGHGGPAGYTLLPGEDFDFWAWDKFNTCIDKLDCHKKVVIMSQCFSGGSIPTLSDTNTIIMTAANDSMMAYMVDSVYFDSIDYPGDPNPGTQYIAYEREIYPGDTMSYRHSEFNFHLLGSIRGMDPGNQSAYYQTSKGNIPFSNADENSDNYTTLEESYNWIIGHDSRMWDDPKKTYWDDPQINDPSNIASETSFEYPTLLHSNITSSKTHRGLIGVSKTIHITNGNELVLKSNSDVHLLNHSDIVVDAGATLTIGDDVEIIGDNGKIEVNGNIVVGLGVKFEETVLDLLNSGLQTTFNTTTFEQSSVNNYGKNFDVVNSYFDNCGVINSYYGDINISYSDFSQSSVYCELPQSSSVKKVTVKGCEFLNQTSLSAIDILSYQNFSIDSNTITNFYNGIQLAQSGSGMAGNQNVLQNEISGATNAAIRLYNTTATLGNNYVYDNNFGLRLFDNCNVALDGNYAASGYDETNFVTDNDSYEIYASSGSFPWYFRYNVIIDEDNLGNPTDPMVYYDITGGGTLIDVKYNCWGNSFNQTADLYPGGYMVNPQLCPSSGGDKSSDVVLQIYLDGLEHFENEEFSDAREIFKEVIEQYPQTTYAPTAMKVLLAVEKVDGNNFNQLQQYYNTADSIQANPVLTKLAGYLSTKCEIEMQNWQTAIDYFEDIIENPDNPEDSIFAIIDLGYTYFLMENSGMKAGITGTMFQHKPQSKQSFAATRDTLLALLPFKKSAENKIDEITNKRIGELLQNIPNPFTGQTTIYFNLQEQAQVVLQIYDHLGKTVKQIEIPDAKEGENNLTIELKNVPGGMYFCSLFVNGKQVDTKKMVVK